MLLLASRLAGQDPLHPAVHLSGSSSYCYLLPVFACRSVSRPLSLYCDSTTLHSQLSCLQECIPSCTRQVIWAVIIGTVSRLAVLSVALCRVLDHLTKSGCLWVVSPWVVGCQWSVTAVSFDPQAPLHQVLPWLRDSSGLVWGLMPGLLALPAM